MKRQTITAVSRTTCCNLGNDGSANWERSHSSFLFYSRNGGVSTKRPILFLPKFPWFTKEDTFSDVFLVKKDVVRLAEKG
jgi:hypothetical protein